MKALQVGIASMLFVGACLAACGGGGDGSPAPLDAGLQPNCGQPTQPSPGCPCDPNTIIPNTGGCGGTFVCHGAPPIWVVLTLGGPCVTMPTPKPPTSGANPLCHVTSMTCSPDEDDYDFNGGTCSRALGDAGTDDGGDGGDGGNAATGACRVARTTGTFSATCSAALTPTGTDGASCIGSAECASGFDCVVDEKGASSCRHYCCSGACKGQPATFCDVAGLVDVNQRVPVCMPIKPCKLLGTGDCAGNESCEVVNEAGATGCVVIGPQQADASCDEDHCAGGLTCLGQPGSRKCYRLCRVAANDCGPTMVCETSTIFKDPSFGVCQKP